MSDQVDDVGGVIAIDQEGNYGKAITTRIMRWASIKEKKLEFGCRKNYIRGKQL